MWIQVIISLLTDLFKPLRKFHSLNPMLYKSATVLIVLIVKVPHPSFPSLRTILKVKVFLLKQHWIKLDSKGKQIMKSLLDRLV